MFFFYCRRNKETKYFSTVKNIQRKKHFVKRIFTQTKVNFYYLPNLEKRSKRKYKNFSNEKRFMKQKDLLCEVDDNLDKEVQDLKENYFVDFHLYDSSLKKVIFDLAPICLLHIHNICNHLDL